MGTTIRIPLIKPALGVAESAHVYKVINSGWVTQGPKVAEFERAFAAYVGAEHAVAVSSCTTALHLALLALGIKRGDEVIVPSHTFIATANAVTYCGAVPVFVDIDRTTFNITPESIASRISSRTKAVLLVHQMGMPADIDGVRKIADRYHLRLIEDAACAIGSEYKGRKIGSHSAAVCFSFHPRKVITTGDGGMITVRNEKLAKRLRLLRQHGMSVNDLARHGSSKVIIEKYPIVGYNYRLTDIQAAVGIEQLKKLPRILRKRKILAERYNKCFSDGFYLIPPVVPEYADPNYQSYCAYVNPDREISREKLMQRLLDMGVATRRGIMSIHREKPYRSVGKGADLVNSEYASDNGIILPLYPQMTGTEHGYVIKSIKKAMDKK